MRYRLQIAYDGTAYAGWQRQKNANTVQETLETAMERALGAFYRVTASGRTDAGVHAVAQVCHFDAEPLRVPADKLPECINRFLPSDVRVVEGAEAEDGFDANRTAKQKTYRYSLYECRLEHPLKERFSVRVDNLPSADALQKICEVFVGEHDFKAFCASGSSVKTTVRTVFSITVEERIEYGLKVVDIFVTGNGFLYNMVRTIVGTALDVAYGKKTKEKVEEAFSTGDRKLVGKTMPAKGLTLYELRY